MSRLPAFAKKFAVDFLETAIGLVLALNLAVPGDMTAARAEALVVGSAVLSALVSAARRAAPAFIAWLRQRADATATPPGAPPD